MIKLNILDIVLDTTVDGPGFRTAVYAAGCPHRCPGCHNPQSWNRDAGREFSVDEVLEVIKAQEFAGVTFTGGDPMVQPRGFAELARRIRSETNKTIWCYTGYTFEQAAECPEKSHLLALVDVLVDGRYIGEQQELSLRFRGSANQRIIDVRASLDAGSVVLWTGTKEDLTAIPSAVLPSRAG